MKKYTIPIFTEEYCVNVIMGTRKQIVKELAKYTGYAEKTIERDFIGRGIFYNMFPDMHPVIAVDSDLKVNIGIATLAHEAIHAVRATEEYLGMDDRNDEFLAHAVSTIIRKSIK